MTPVEHARHAAGLSLEQAAALIGVSPRYVRQAELHGAPYALASRLAYLYGIDIKAFLLSGAPGRLDKAGRRRAKRRLVITEGRH